MYYYQTPIGYLLIKTDDEDKVLSAFFEDIQGEYDEEVSGNLKKDLDAYFLQKVTLPLSWLSKDIKGTDFQKLVWKSIATVPFGHTSTYKKLATEIGNQNASRAFGTACGKNSVALFIPCHRIIKSKQDTFSYRWGSERKKWLLFFEKEKESE